MKLGLTGGIGCGKSTAAQFFEQEGFCRVDTDSLAKEILDGDASVREALQARWGQSVFTGTGQVDFKAVAQKVFGDKEEELRWLEQLLHPLVNRAWRMQLEKAPEKRWLVEIPLLFEKKLEKAFDFVVCVEASPHTQQSRLAGRFEGVQARMARQLPLEEKVQRADYVLSNDGSIAQLQEQVRHLTQQLT